MLKMMSKGSVCLLADSAKDDNTTKDNDVASHSVCDQEIPNGKLWDHFLILFLLENITY